MISLKSNNSRSFSTFYCVSYTRARFTGRVRGSTRVHNPSSCPFQLLRWAGAAGEWIWNGNNFIISIFPVLGESIHHCMENTKGTRDGFHSTSKIRFTPRWFKWPPPSQAIPRGNQRQEEKKRNGGPLKSARITSGTLFFLGYINKLTGESRWNSISFYWIITES